MSAREKGRKESERKIVFAFEDVFESDNECEKEEKYVCEQGHKFR